MRHRPSASRRRAARYRRLALAGLTLGGGIGWLMRAHGLACDNLLSADVVTADGEFHTAGPEEEPDLFWALRGGGGNFGVVTSFEFRLHHLGPILGGMLFYPYARAKEVLRFYRDFTLEALDGEICCLEPDGRTHFNKLLFRREWPHFYAFDVLSIEGEDLTRLPPLERKRRLLSIMPTIESRLLSSITFTSAARICSGPRARQTSKASWQSGQRAPIAPMAAPRPG